VSKPAESKPTDDPNPEAGTKISKAEDSRPVPKSERMAERSGGSQGRGGSEWYPKSDKGGKSDKGDSSNGGWGKGSSRSGDSRGR
jgi:hypothetical protein